MSSQADVLAGSVLFSSQVLCPFHCAGSSQAGPGGGGQVRPRGHLFPGKYIYIITSPIGHLTAKQISVWFYDVTEGEHFETITIPE